MSHLQHTLALDGFRVTVGSAGASWAVGCYEADCTSTIIGYFNRDAAARGGMHHLLWHIHGKPTCVDCGAWLSHRTSIRCRKGTCEVSR